MIAFRQCDRRYPFLWESPDQPAARWNAEEDGPVQYLADTPDGAWAEFLRYEEITDEADLAGVSRGMWAVEIDEPEFAEPQLTREILVGGPVTYPACRDEARRVRREQGAHALRAPSAALLPGCAGGYRVELGLRVGPETDGQVFVLFGTRPDACGWMIVDDGRPPRSLIGTVRPLAE
ncbi:RES domain-containing protein [Tomitella gaofuii]|uniref:RES domain-containing protein n=1 Tax=Tomitella gaofuii TaxID=2760083 RepID=UPI0015FB4F5F|nr:RES domain-containing protein [Tomitella gaofuii]